MDELNFQPRTVTDP